MKFSITEIKGKHNQIFVTKKILISEDYKTFWTKLANEQPTSGTFERVNMKGKKVMLNAIYNPIRNASGKVMKVIKFASEIN